MNSHRLAMNVNAESLGSYEQLIGQFRDLTLSKFFRDSMRVLEWAIAHYEREPRGRAIVKLRKGGSINLVIPRKDQYASTKKARSAFPNPDLKLVEIRLDREDLANLDRLKTYLGKNSKTLAVARAATFYADVLKWSQKSDGVRYQDPDGTEYRLDEAAPLPVVAEFSVQEMQAQLRQLTQQFNSMKKTQVQIFRDVSMMNMLLLHQMGHLTRDLIENESNDHTDRLIRTLAQFCYYIVGEVERWCDPDYEFQVTIKAFVGENEVRLIAAAESYSPVVSLMSFDDKVTRATDNPLFAAVTTPEHRISVGPHMAVAPIRMSKTNHPDEVEMLGFICLRCVSRDLPGPFSEEEVDSPLNHLLLGYADLIFMFLKQEGKRSGEKLHSMNRKLAKAYIAGKWEKVRIDPPKLLGSA